MKSTRRAQAAFHTREKNRKNEEEKGSNDRFAGEIEKTKCFLFSAEQRNYTQGKEKGMQENNTIREPGDMFQGIQKNSLTPSQKTE